MGGFQHQLDNLNIVGNLFLTSDRVVTVQSQFILAVGLLNLGGQHLTVRTGQFTVGDGGTNGSATLEGIGVVEADVPIRVSGNGVVSPGGLRFVGTMRIEGSIEFQRDSTFVVDLDATTDNLHATGSVVLDPGAMLFGGSGVLGDAGPFEILTADGGLTGRFANPQVPIGLADDVVAVSYTDSAVVLEPAPMSNVKQVSGATSDGTLYTIRLTGGGNAQLQVFESYKVGGVVEYLTVTEKRQRPVTVSFPETVTRTIRTVEYETVPVDTGTSTVYVTIPVLKEIETAVTVYREATEMVEETVQRNIAELRDALVHTLEIRVTNSTRANQLVIATTPHGGSGKLDVGNVHVAGALGALVAPTATFGTLQVDGYLGNLRLAHLRGTMSAGGNANQRTTIAIQRIDGDITTGSSIASLTSNQVGQLSINAPRIDRLVTTASPLNQLTGDFNAYLSLDAGSGSALALGYVSIAGGISNSTWYIGGSVGTVTVKQVIEDWFLIDSSGTPRGDIQSLNLGEVHHSSIWWSGRIGKLTAASWDGYEIQAQSLGALEVAGNFAAFLELDAGLGTARALGHATLGSVAGAWNIHGSLGSVTVRQQVNGWNLGGQLGAIQALLLGGVDRLDVYALGHIGTLTAEFTPATNRNSTIQAGSIGTLNITGDFTGSLVLDAGDVTRMALRSAHLEGIHGSVWDIRGSIGTIQVDNSASDWILGTNGDSFQHADELGDLRQLSIGGQLQNSAIHVAGRIGSLRASQWQITDVTARSLGALNVIGNPAHGWAGAFLFSNVSLSGASNRVGLGAVTITGLVWGSTFNVLAGNVTSFTCGQFQHSGLYVGYVPADGADLRTLGQFLGTWKLGVFTTTALPVVAHQSDPRTDGFQASEIVASSFGRVTLTGVFINNGGVIFGLRVNGASNAGKVRVDTAPFSLNANVRPGTTKGDFQFLTS